MPDKHESCNKYDRLSHTSALGGLFIADESEKAQEEIQKSCVFGNDNPSLAGAGQVCLHFSGRGFRAVDDGNGRAAGTCDGDGLSVEIDVLEVGGGGDEDDVAGGGGVDSVLDTGLGGNVDRGCGHRG
jgi:hypothetical protein